jgi:hypothetical protein
MPKPGEMVSKLTSICEINMIYASVAAHGVSQLKGWKPTAASLSEW